MLALPQTERGRFVDFLSELYSGRQIYPSDPNIDECEIKIVETGTVCHGGFANCREGLFLGQHKVAMKSLRDHILPEIVQRVWCLFFWLLISLTI